MSVLFSLFWTLMIIGPVAVWIAAGGHFWYAALAYDMLPLTDPNDLGAWRAQRVGKRLCVVAAVWSVASITYFAIVLH